MGWPAQRVEDATGLPALGGFHRPSEVRRPPPRINLAASARSGYPQERMNAPALKARDAGVSPPAQKARDADWKRLASAAMDRYAAGDDAAFSKVYELLSPWLMGIFRRRVRDEALAEDLLQRTLLQMHLARCHFLSGSSVTPWAYAIAQRVAVDAFRQSRKGRPQLQDLTESLEIASPRAQVDDLVAQKLLMRELSQAVSRMPHAHRQTFELVLCDGLSPSEAAEVLGTTESAVRVRIFRIREGLRKALGIEIRDALGGST